VLGLTCLPRAGAPRPIFLRQTLGWTLVSFILGFFLMQNKVQTAYFAVWFLPDYFIDDLFDRL